MILLTGSTLAQNNVILYQNQGVSFSYDYTYETSGTNRDNQQVKSWLVTVKVVNNSGRNINLPDYPKAFWNSVMPWPNGWVPSDNFNLNSGRLGNGSSFSKQGRVFTWGNVAALGPPKWSFAGFSFVD